MTSSVDVGVVGLGTMGSMALWRLAERGVRVHGYERFGVGHHRGAAGGQTRRFSTLSQHNQRNTPLALEALELWRELHRTTEHEVLTLTGGLIFGPQDTPALLSAIESARANDLVHDVLGPEDLKSRFPQHHIRIGDAGVVDELTGYIRPELSVVAAVEAAMGAGATLSQYTRVLGIESRGDHVVVRTDGGETHHDAVVVAPGAWASQLVPGAGADVVPRRLVQAWYVPQDIALYRAERFPVFERVGDVRAYGFPTVDGATVKLGFWTGEHPVVGDLEDVDHVIDVAKALELREQVARFLPGLHPEPVNLSIHIEGYTHDSTPLVGPVPGHDGVYAACGFSGSGFKFAPVMGDIVADYVIDGGTRRDAGFMLPQDARPAVAPSR